MTRTPGSLLKKPPGEGTGPTTHTDSRGIIVGRVPLRGEQDVLNGLPGLTTSPPRTAMHAVTVSGIFRIELTRPL